MKAVVIIPAFNEARTIRDIVTRSLAHGLDVAVIDDGSQDATVAEIADLPITVLRHSTNEGKAAALATGFDWGLRTTADALVTLDGDGQHRPEDIPRLLAAARLYPDRLIIGARLHNRAAYPRARRFANQFADFWIAWASGHPLIDSQSGLRVYPTRLLRLLSRPGDRRAGFSFESEFVIRAARSGHTTIAVPIQAIHHAAGRPSHFRPVRDIARIVVMVASYLLRYGMYPQGLWRVLRDEPRIADVETRPPDAAGEAYEFRA